MRVRIKNTEGFAALCLWCTSVAGKVDVFCYESGGVDPKRSDHPAYSNEREYQLLNQDSWDQVSAVSIFICLHSVLLLLAYTKYSSLSKILLPLE
jgi:hypothetical protein